MKRLLSDIINTEALEFAMYTIENRALPNMIDGLKPVQRFALYNVIKEASRDYNKVAALGSSVAKLGYNHGETSAQDALASMAAEWTNNVPFIAGRGNFGSRMVQEPAAARYVYAKLHDNFHKYFKDTDLAPEHSDVEHIPPAYYVPVVPTVLLNGVTGIATGFATNILPHCPIWVAQATADCLNGKEMSEPVVKFPAFDGKIVKDDNRYIQYGAYTVSGLTVTVTDIPTKFDHEKYCKVLDALEDAGTISSYVDETGDTFQFKVRFKRGSKMTDRKIQSLLKLTAAYSPNINVINHNGKLASYDDVRDLIKDFVEYRKTFLDKRIKSGRKLAQQRVSLATAKVVFIESVIAGERVLHGKTKAMLTKELKPIYGNHVSDLLNMTMDKMTDDEVNRLKKSADEANKELRHWETTTPIKEFQTDLRGLSNDK